MIKQSMPLRVYSIAWLGKIKTDFWRDFWGIRGCVPNRRGSQGLFFTKIKNKPWVPPHLFVSVLGLSNSFDKADLCPLGKNC